MSSSYPTRTKVFLKETIMSHDPGSTGVILKKKGLFTYVLVDGCDGCSNIRRPTINEGNYCDGVSEPSLFFNVLENSRRKAKLIDRGTYYELEYIE